MEHLSLFALASQKNRWLAERQAVVAQNVANANTPGFKAKDIEPFEAAMERTGFQLAAPRVGHLTLGGAGRVSATPVNAPEGDGSHSGNTVNIEQEMMKLGAINREYGLSAGILKSFQRMLMTSTRG